MNLDKFFLGVTLAVVCGCATTSNVSVTSGVTAIDKDVIADRPVELPGGYDVKDFRRLVMGVHDGKIQSNSSAFKKQDIVDYMNLRFQSEMDTHKRFKFVAMHGNDTSRIDAAKDQGLMASDEDMDAKEIKDPSLVLNWNINIQEKKEAEGSHGQKFLWYCTVNATVVYAKDVKEKGSDKIKFNKGFIAFTRDFDLPVIEKSQTLSSTGAVKSGFSYKSDADVQALMQEIMVAASQRIADDLGRKFPVGGRVVDALGDDLMTMDKGARQGVESEMQMVIFARYKGVDVPLANATAKPAQDETQLTVWRFSKDKYAKQILAEIAGDVDQWTEKVDKKGRKNELYAVRAVPPQDDKKGTRFE